MALSIVTSKTGQRPPRWPFAIDYDAPAARGLIACFHPGFPGGSTIPGSIKSLRHTPGHGLGGSGYFRSSNVTIQHDSEMGFVWDFPLINNTDDTIYVTPVASDFYEKQATPMTVCARALCRSVSTRGGIVSCDTSFSGVGWVLYKEGTGTQWRFAWDGWNNGATVGTGAPGLNEWANLVGTRYYGDFGETVNGGSLWANAVRNDDATSYDETSGGGPYLGIGNAASGAAAGTRRLPDAMITDVRIYRRAFSDGDAYDYIDPQTRWDLYYELGRKSIFIPAAAGGGSVTGGLDGSLHHLQSAFAGLVSTLGVLDGNVQHLQSALVGEAPVHADLQGEAHHTVAAFGGTAASAYVAGALDGSTHHAAAEFVGEQEVPGALEGNVHHIASALGGWTSVAGDLDGSTHHTTAAIAGEQEVPGELSAEAHHIASAMVGGQDIRGELDGSIHHLMARFNWIETIARKIWFMTKRQLWTRGFKRR